MGGSLATVGMDLLPLYVQVALTFVLLLRLGSVRLAEVRAGRVDLARYAAGEEVWPPKVKAAAAAFRNQFELPVLFYLVTVLAFVTDRMTYLFVILSWLFVGSRIVHAVIFVTTNYVPNRFRVFVIGFVILAVMWVVFLATPLIA